MKAALHFVGFRGTEYISAIRVWGLPDFYHRWWDHRACGDVAPGDTIIFAREKDLQNLPRLQAFNDSEVF